MKTKMLFTAVLCLFMFTGLTKSVAQDVQIPIYLPYSGQYNDWYITFTKVGTTETYFFHTDNSTFNSQILGTLPAGTYDIEFQSGHFPKAFDFGVCGMNYYQYKIRSDGFYWLGAVIDETTFLAIDEGY